MPHNPFDTTRPPYRLMTEPLRDSARTTSPSEDTDRATRIEELLISGLDHYFAADYEQAINIWTRVVFLERDHDRARAYIERARTAIAERQRESEELLHHGVDAYNSGDVARARELLTKAVDQGAPSDEALVLLNRLDRFEGVGFDAPLYHSGSPARTVAAAMRSPAARHPWKWAVAGTAVLLAAAAVALGGAPVLSWMMDVPGAATQTVPTADPLPIVRTSDMLLDRARSLYVGGHLRDALRLLERIDVADPARPDSDRLRAEIQHDLLASAPGGTAARPSAEPAP